MASLSLVAEVLGSINNTFEHDRYSGEYLIHGGILSTVRGDSPKFTAGQYYIIEGSILNDGLHQVGDGDMTDEDAFAGTIIACAVPHDLMHLINEIGEWREANGAAGPYQSESFDGYSYTRATDSVTGEVAGWRSHFRARLNRWRKL